MTGKLMPFLCAITIAYSQSNAQTSPPTILWQHTYGGSLEDEARDLQLTPDGGYIFIGYEKSNDHNVTGNHGLGDFWIVKLDVNGVIQWQKPYGGSQEDWGRCIYLTSDGGYITTGFERSNNGDVTGNHGSYDYWVIKLDVNGNMQWQKTFGGSGFDNSYNIQETTDGGYLVTGYVNSTDGQVTGEHGNEDYWVVKLDHSGSLLWQKALGGSGFDEASNVLPTSDGGYVICGYSSSNDGDVTGNHGSYDSWTVKINSTGSIVWQKSYGGSLEDGSRDLIATPDGGFIITGFAYSNDGNVSGNHGNADVWVYKIDANGNLIWQKSYGGSDYEYTYSIQKANDGNYLIAGYTQSANGDVTGSKGQYDVWILKIDGNGNLIWQKTLGGSGRDLGRNLVQTPDGQYVLSGYTDSNDGDVSGNLGGVDCWVVKLCDQTNFYADTDHDGYGNPSSSVLSCAAPSGYVSNNTDCNDANASVHPNAIETCNGIDDNCNSQIDEGAKSTFYADSDGDTYGNAASSTLACTVPNGYVSNNTDCNDANASIHPNATEICNGIDDNCNSQIDEGVKSTFYADSDGDTYGNAASSTLACTAPNGYVSNNTDCNDANASIRPNATEICNGIDDNCNSQIDEGVQSTFYADSDGDTYGNAASSTLACTAPNGYVSNNTDCNDTNASINPNAPEICNGIDDNCNGQIDEGVKSTFYADSDGDTYGNAASSTLACTAPNGYVSNNTDCNDANASIRPNATEICNGIDDNCNSQIDEGAKSTFYADSDGDTYGDAASSTLACTTPDGYVSNNTDCNDANASIYPSATEICNGIDDNCNSQIDEGAKSTFYADSDGDTYGNAASSTLACTVSNGYVADNTDCDDSNPSIYPNAIEVCNSIDDNCNGAIDEESPRTLYLDADLDSFGSIDSSIVITTCNIPPQFVSNNTDCNDTDAAINPNAPEICNGLDDNCNGGIDEGVQSTFYQDADHDGFGDPNGPINACTVPQGFVTNNDDCNDQDDSINPDANEICGNNTDENCDGVLDDGCTIYYADLDSDGYGNPNSTIVGAPIPPLGYVSAAGDCNDTNPSVHPNAAETCNGIDDNCNSQIDEGVKSTFYSDADADTYGNAASPTLACAAPNGYVSNNTDCNDANASIRPNATEICNGIDDNCNSQIDEGVKLTFYADADGDTYGNPASSTLACTVPKEYVSNNTDCNDANASVHPNATEICNGMDDNCNSQIDEGVKLTFYADADGDTYGNAASSTLACTTPNGYVSNNTDCNDANGSIHPNAIEICNSIDDDCNSQIDENTFTASITAGGATSFCDGGSVKLTANPNGTGYTFVWRLNASAISGATAKNYTATATGNYSVIVTKTGCSSTSSGMQVNNYGKPSLSVSPAGIVNLCKGNTIVLTANSAMASSYQWKSNSKNISGATGSTYSTTKSGSYTVTVTNANGCSNTSATTTVNQVAAPQATITPQGSLDICVTHQVVLSANAGMSSYTWFKGSTVIAGATSQNYTATKAASYKVTITDANNCSSTSAVTKVTSSCREGAPETAANSDQLSVYPNPNNGYFIVSLTVAEEIDQPMVVEIINLMGQVVYAEKDLVKNRVVSKEIHLPGGANAGIYFLKVKIDDKEFIQRLVYQR